MLMSVILYKERLFADASYYLFKAINSGFFHVEHGRLVLGISQLAPLLASYLHFPMQWVLIIASMGHELFYYSIFLFLFYRLNDRRGAIAVLLIHLIGQLWLYYSPMLEICYGAALAVLFYALLSKEKYKSDVSLVLLLLIQWFVMTSHPENFILIAVGIGYDYLKRGFQKNIHLTTFLFLCIGFLIEISTFSAYEVGHASQLMTNETVGNFKNLFSIPYWRGIEETARNFYPDLLILFFVAFYSILKRHAIKEFILFIGSVALLLLMVHATFAANDFNRYNESLHSPLVFIIVFFAVYESFHWKKKHQMTFFVLCCGIALLRVFWIYDYGKPLRLRMAQMDRLVDYAQNIGGSKFLINSDNYHSDYTSITWANPIETLFCSAIDGKEQSLSIATEGEYKFNKNHKFLNDTNYIFRRFEIEPIDFLNGQYFVFEQGHYHYLNSARLEGDIATLSKNVSVKQDWRHVKEFYKTGDTALIRLHLHNKNDVYLPSKEDQKLYLSYHLYQNDELIEWNGIRTLLEVDLRGEYWQDMRIALPEEAGLYQIVPDIVVDGKGWFNLTEGTEIAVIY